MPWEWAIISLGSVPNSSNESHWKGLGADYILQEERPANVKGITIETVQRKERRKESKNWEEFK